MLTADDEREPQAHDIDSGLEDSAEIEELRFAVRAMIVMNRNLGDPEARVLNLLHHLEANHTARLLQMDAVEDRAPHQAEIAIHVSNRQPEQDADDVVVQAADDDSMHGIGPAD